MRTLTLLSYLSVLCFLMYSCPGVESRVISKRSAEFSSIFAFGDSYTDNGSLQNLYEQKSTKIYDSRYNVTYGTMFVDVFAYLIFIYSLHPSTAKTVRCNKACFNLNHSNAPVTHS